MQTKLKKKDCFFLICNVHFFFMIEIKIMKKSSLRHAWLMDRWRHRCIYVQNLNIIKIENHLLHPVQRQSCIQSIEFQSAKQDGSQRTTNIPRLLQSPVEADLTSIIDPYTTSDLLKYLSCRTTSKKDALSFKL